MNEEDIHVVMSLLCQCNDEDCPVRHIGEHLPQLNDDNSGERVTCSAWPHILHESRSKILTYLHTAYADEMASSIGFYVPQPVTGRRRSNHTAFSIRIENGSIIEDRTGEFIVSISDPMITNKFWAHYRQFLIDDIQPILDIIERLGQ